MDPYIERPEIWPDFHDSLIAGMRGALQPGLRPQYAAVTQERPYAVEAERPIRPDVSVVRTPADVTLDLQATFTRCWNEGPYPELLHYSGAAPGALTEVEARWCDEMLRDVRAS